MAQCVQIFNFSKKVRRPMQRLPAISNKLFFAIVKDTHGTVVERIHNRAQSAVWSQLLREHDL